jgi:transcriptional regulator with XRE-family HTH domain
MDTLGKRRTLVFESTRLAQDVTSQITGYMAEQGVTRAALAAQMKITPGRVSQILSGDENLTLKTLAAVALALDAHVEIRIASSDAYSGGGVAGGDRAAPGGRPGSP